MQDASACMQSEPLARVIGKPVVVDNKGGGNVAYSQVARATRTATPS